MALVKFLKDISSFLFLCSSCILGIVATAQETPALVPAVEKPAEMVKLSELLERRAVAEEMVPAAAAQDQDFIRFISAIRSRSTVSNQPRPVARRFEIESQTSGVNTYEMYLRLKGILLDLKDDTELLNSALDKKRQGLGYSTKQLCVNTQVCLGVGAFLGVGIGVERRGRWMIPIFTIRGGGTSYSNEGPAFGGFAELGFETRQDDGTSEIVERANGDVSGGAVGVGMSSGKFFPNSKVDSLVAGIGPNFSDRHGVQAKIPLFFPLPSSDPVGKALKLQAKIARALQHFNFAEVANLIPEYKSAIRRASARYLEQSGSALVGAKLDDGHPLGSPGALFSGSSMVVYSPNLVPDLVAAYKMNGKGTGEVCEAPVARTTRKGGTLPE